MSSQNDNIIVTLINQFIFFATQLATPDHLKDKRGILLGEDRLNEEFQSYYKRLSLLGIDTDAILKDQKLIK